MYELFTDGCVKRKGGWGFLLINRNTGTRCEGYGELNTVDVNVTELYAVIMGLEKTPIGASIKIFTDSQFVIRGVKKPKEIYFKYENWIKIFTLIASRNISFVKTNSQYSTNHRTAHHLARRILCT